MAARGRRMLACDSALIHSGQRQGVGPGAAARGKSKGTQVALPLELGHGEAVAEPPRPPGGSTAGAEETAAATAAAATAATDSGDAADAASAVFVFVVVGWKAPRPPRKPGHGVDPGGHAWVHGAPLHLAVRPPRQLAAQEHHLGLGNRIKHGLDGSPDAGEDGRRVEENNLPHALRVMCGKPGKEQRGSARRGGKSLSQRPGWLMET